MNDAPSDERESREDVGPHATTELTNRLFLLGAGFSKPAGLPLATELLDLVIAVARSRWDVDGRSHLERDLEAYEEYLADTVSTTLENEADATLENEATGSVVSSLPCPGF